MHGDVGPGGHNFGLGSADTGPRRIDKVNLGVALHLRVSGHGSHGSFTTDRLVPRGVGSILDGGLLRQDRRLESSLCLGKAVFGGPNTP